MPKPDQCLMCHEPAKHRGLCVSHYQSAMRAVRVGKATWPELESLGLANKSKRPQSFAAILKAARAAKKSK